MNPQKKWKDLTNEEQLNLFDIYEEMHRDFLYNILMKELLARKVPDFQAIGLILTTLIQALNHHARKTIKSDFIGFEEKTFLLKEGLKTISLAANIWEKEITKELKNEKEL